MSNRKQIEACAARLPDGHRQTFVDGLASAERLRKLASEVQRAHWDFYRTTLGIKKGYRFPPQPAPVCNPHLQALDRDELAGIKLGGISGEDAMQLFAVNEKVSTADYFRHFNTSRSKASRDLKELRRRGLISIDSHDKRKNVMKITSAGIAAWNSSASRARIDVQGRDVQCRYQQDSCDEINVGDSTASVECADAGFQPGSGNGLAGDSDCDTDGCSQELK